jgi:hypothetical protein
MATAMPVIFPRQFGHSGPPPSQEYLDESNVVFILSLTGTFTAAAVLVVILRMYVRICMLRFVGFDDWTMVLAALMALGSFTCMCGESFYGMGRHVEWPQPWMIGPLFRWIFAHGIIVMLGVVLVKISVAFFLMRIMLKKGWQIFLWGSIGGWLRSVLIVRYQQTDIHSLPDVLWLSMYRYPLVPMLANIRELECFLPKETQRALLLTPNLQLHWFVQLSYQHHDRCPLRHPPDPRHSETASQ